MKDLHGASKFEGGLVEEGYVLEVEAGKTYLLRLINAALMSEYYFKIAGHKFTVVAADANYVKPYTTDVIAIAPGETVDALLVADAAPERSYYMVALANQPSIANPPFPVTVTRGTLRYLNGDDDPAGAGDDALAPGPARHGALLLLPRQPDQPEAAAPARAEDGAGARRRAPARHALHGLRLPERRRVLRAGREHRA
jgi:laccase